MHIIRGQTRRFQDYEVLVSTQQRRQPKTRFQKFMWDWIYRGWYPMEDVEIAVPGVVEADEKTGLLITQEYDEFGNALYSNGLDTISNDNAVKILLLAPVFRSAFHQAGFRPKLTQSYRKLKIRYNGPPQVEVIQAEKRKPELVEATKQ